MAGYYDNPDRYQISSWLLGCLEREIDSHVQAERVSIARIAQNRICFEHKDGCDHAACYALSDLIRTIRGELK